MQCIFSPKVKPGKLLTTVSKDLECLNNILEKTCNLLVCQMHSFVMQVLNYICNKSGLWQSCFNRIWYKDLYFNSYFLVPSIFKYSI